MSKHNSSPTVKIQTEPTAGNPSGVVTINESDYNPEVHTLFVEGEELELTGNGEGTSLPPAGGDNDPEGSNSTGDKKPWEV